MKNNYIRLFLFAGLIVFSVMTTQAQKIVTKKSFTPYWEAGVNGGSSLFFGDVKQNAFMPVSSDNNEWRLGGSLWGGYQFSYIFGLRGQALYGQIAGTKRSADYFFEGDYIEFNMNTTINLNNLFGKKRTDRFASAYVLVGVGLTNYNTTIYKLSTGAVQRKIGFGNGSGIGGRTLEGILTGGVGVNFRINKNLIVNFETANRIMNSDEMDGWVKNFKYDVYNYTAVGITYRFGARKSRSLPAATPETTHQNVQQVLPVKKTQPEKKKQPCTVEMQPVMPATTDTTTAKKVQKTETQVKKSQQKPVVPVVTQKQTKTQPARPIIEYRVQIRAKYGKPVSIAWLSKRYGIPQNEIRQDKHNGYYIYTIGSFQTYEAARYRRDELRSRNGIHDAFVVAFKNGYRLDKLP